jgi:hypothetical protein
LQRAQERGKVRRRNIDGLAKDQKYSLSLDGRGRGEDDPARDSNVFFPLPLIPSHEGRGILLFTRSSMLTDDEYPLYISF